MGREKKSVVWEFYIIASRDEQIKFCVQPTGLHVNPSFHHIGASPDGIASCICWGSGLLEIKCPYSKRDIDLKQVE